MTEATAGKLAKAIILLLSYKKELSTSKKTENEREYLAAKRRLDRSYTILSTIIRKAKKDEIIQNLTP